MDSFPDMPPNAERAYHIWLTTAGRSIKQTATQLNIPIGTVNGYHAKYRWTARAQSEDMAKRDANIAAAYVRLASLLPDSVRCIADAVAGSDVTATQLKAAFGTLDRFGISPLQRATVDVMARNGVDLNPVSDTDLDRMLAAGDVAGLLAIASGRAPQHDPATALPYTPPAGRQDISEGGGRQADHPEPVPVGEPATVIEGEYTVCEE